MGPGFEKMTFFFFFKKRKEDYSQERNLADEHGGSNKEGHFQGTESFSLTLKVNIRLIRLCSANH